MARNALGAHAGDELALSAATATRPAQAAQAWAASFSVGAALPIGVVLAVSPAPLMVWVLMASLGFVAGLDAVSARAGRSAIWPGTWRVAFRGDAAMVATAGAVALLGAVA